MHKLYMFDKITGLSPSGHTMALGLTQPLKEMGTRNISWGVKAASSQGSQPYHLHVPTVLKSGSLNLPESSAPVQASNGIPLPFTGLSSSVYKTSISLLEN